MSDIELYISNLVKNQFPSFYKDEGPTLIAFIQAYYEWMESGTQFSDGQTLYHDRRILEYSDIDETVEDFIVHFKNTYLAGIQFDTVTDKRLVVKKILDLYRTKGSPRSIALLFRLVYGEDITLYYPGKDIFKSSDNSWVVPTYLEISDNPLNPSYLGKTVVGVSTGATAFVDRIVKRQIKSKYVDILFISNIKNEFETGEKLRLQSNTDISAVPIIIGSTTDLNVVDGGANFSIGEIVELISENGVSGKAVVTEVSAVTGVVNFKLLDGGFGYNLSSNVFISDKVITVSNVQVTSNSVIYSPWNVLEQVTFVSSNGSIANVTANVIGMGANSTFHVSNVVGTFLVNETVQVGNASASFVTIIPSQTDISKATISTSNRVNAFHTGLTIVGARSGATAVLDSYDTLLGVNNLSAGIDATNFTYFVGNTTGTHANLTTVSFGSGASVNIGSVVITDSFFLNTDYLSGNNLAGVPYLTIKLNGANSGLPSNGYGFPFNPAANINSTLAQALTYKFESVGYISSLSNINPGVQYNYAPFVLFYNDDVARLKKKGYILTIPDASKQFVIGETITQNVPYTSATTLTVNGSTGFSYNTLAYESNGSANIAVGKVIALTSNNIVVQTVVGAFTTSNSSTLLYGSNVQYVNGITVGGTARVGYNNSDYIVVSNGTVNAHANISTNATGGFVTANVTVSNGGVFPMSSNGTNVLVSIYAANGAASNGTGGTFTATFLSLPSNTYISAVNNSTYNVTAVGLVLAQTGNTVIVRRQSISQDFVTGANLYGSSSGVNVNCVGVTEYSNSVISAENATVNDYVQSATGSVTALKLKGSGFGYVNTETVNFVSEANAPNFGVAQVITGKRGIGQGYFLNTNGFLDADKYIQDGYYYQDFSYEIQSSLNFDKYADMVKNVVHVAGTQLFGSVFRVVQANVENVSAKLTITQA